MSISFNKTALFGMLLIIYGLLFYFLYSLQVRSDFSCFYASALAYSQNMDPYQNLIAHFLPIPSKISVNLNPPFFLELITPFTKISFPNATALWSILNFVLGLSGALISFKLCFTAEFFKKNWFYLAFIYLAMHASLMNTSLSQVGGLLIFFIMTGYYFFLRKQDYLAGLLWGFIISIKLFPALLFLFVLQQKRYKLFLTMLVTCIVTCLIPFVSKGANNYFLYFDLFPHIYWYGDNWNASLYGFLFRLFVGDAPSANVIPVKMVFLCISIVLVLWYYKKISAMKGEVNDHRAFALTLVLMLFLSPFGWLYYFSLLVMPLSLIWLSLRPKDLALWVLCLFLINFPIGYVHVVDMGSTFLKLSYYSFYFYGLIFCLILTSRLKLPNIPNQPYPSSYLYPLQITLIMSLMVVFVSLLLHLYGVSLINL